VPDVTEHIRALEALQRECDQFKAIAEHSPDVVSRFDRGLRYLLTNPAQIYASGFMSGKLLEKTGIAIEQHIGRTRWELPKPSVTKGDWARHRAQLEAREPLRDFGDLKSPMSPKISSRRAIHRAKPGLAAKTRRYREGRP
jgi:PAS domain-containing protein